MFDDEHVFRCILPASVRLLNSNRFLEASDLMCKRDEKRKAPSNRPPIPYAATLSDLPKRNVGNGASEYDGKELSSRVVCEGAKTHPFVDQTHFSNQLCIEFRTVDHRRASPRLGASICSHQAMD